MNGLVNAALFPVLRPEWLALNKETAVDPRRPVIDSHHHLWGPQPSQYMEPELIDDVTATHNVVATVYVECRFHYRPDGPELLRPIGEIEFARRVGENAPEGRRLCAGIVGFVDLLKLGNDADAALEAAIEAGQGRLSAIRNITAWSADTRAVPPMPGRFEGHLRHETFRDGFRRLARRGLPFEAFVYQTQIEDVIDLARAFPDTPIVLGHIGGPVEVGLPTADGKAAYDRWRALVLKLAQCPNVFMKLSGMGMRITRFDMDRRELPPTSDDLAEAWRPLFSVVIDAFGPSRCMFGSNFPVDKGGYSYAAMWNAFEKISAGLSEAEKDRLFRGTVSDVYKLKL
ncbi:MAG: amidohydrolase family protein [Mesorhizobium sp.]